MFSQKVKLTKHQFELSTLLISILLGHVLHHPWYSGDVVVGWTDEAEQVFHGVLHVRDIYLKNYQPPPLPKLLQMVGGVEG